MKSLLLTILTLTVGSTFAGGSESFTSHVLPILQQDKDFTKALLNSFEFNDAVWAQTKMGSHTKFGGQRLGPYTVLAKPKGSKSEWVYELTINTKWTVYDEEGNEVPLLDENGKSSGIFDPNAMRIEETFINIELKRYEEKQLEPAI